MRHGMVNRKLGRKSGHRLALFRNQLASLVDKERIITTLPKAKELRPQIERLVTLGRTDSVHARRQAFSVLQDDTLVTKLFGTIAPRFATRPGGYTRIIKIGARRGDDAERAIIEFVDFELKGETAAPATTGGKEKGGKKKDDDAPAADETPKKKTSKKAAAKGDDDAAKSGDDKPKKSRKKKSDEE